MHPGISSENRRERQPDPDSMHEVTTGRSTGPSSTSGGTPEQEQVQSLPEAPAYPAEALIESGAGFAVINIDF